MVPSSDPASTRLRFLDAARGGAMFFVLLSHCASTYFVRPEVSGWRWGLVRVGMIATPTFVMLSGMLLGAHYRTARAGFSRIQARLVDRGLFLILVSHAVIALPQGQWDLVVYSTDGLGVAMILSVLLLPGMRKYSRLAAGVGAYVVSWLAIYFWHPAPGPGGGAIVKEALFGSLVPTALQDGTFPIVPWFAVYLISSVFGERLAALYTKGSTRRLACEFLFLGVGGVATAVGIELLAWWIGGLSAPRNIASTLIWMGQKSPPAPLYLLCYGGAGMLLIVACLVAEKGGWFRRPFRYAAVCGEASLFVYFAHFYMMWFGRHILGPGGLARGFVYLVLSTAALVMGAHVWQHRRGNRFFTVRYAIGSERFTRFTTHLHLETVPVMWVDGAR